MRHNPSDEEVKALLRLSQKRKGHVDLAFLERVLELIDFRIGKADVAVDMGKLYDGDRVVASMLKEWGQRFNLRHISGPRYGNPKVWTFYFNTPTAGEAASDLPRVVRVVDAAPSRPEIGQLYAKDIKAVSQIELHVKQIWLGATAIVLTAPNGKSTTIPLPLTRHGLAEDGPYNLAPLWTFLYKNGAAEAAKAYLATVPEQVAAATRTKAERERIERRRSALPKIEAIFTEITNARYDEIVSWLLERYLNEVKYVLRKQQEGTLKYRDVSTTAHKLMTQVYGPGPGYTLVWQAKPDFEQIAKSMAKESADAAREAFVEKNTYRISEIARVKGESPTAQLLYIEPGATFNSEIRFSFPDGSQFDLRNKTVWKTSALGLHFAQFPTTFHNVSLPGGKKMASPSEGRMLDVFAKGGEAKNPSTTAYKRLLNPW